MSMNIYIYIFVTMNIYILNYNMHTNYPRMNIHDWSVNSNIWLDVLSCSFFDIHFLVFRRQWRLLLGLLNFSSVIRIRFREVFGTNVMKHSITKSVCWSFQVSCVNFTGVDVDPLPSPPSKHLCDSVSSLVQDFPNNCEQSSHGGTIFWLQLLELWFSLHHFHYLVYDNY